MRRAVLFLLLAGCAATRESDESKLDRAIRSGISHLLSTQGPDGSWGTGRETTGFDVMADVPGSHDAFRVGATALCVLALRECGEREGSLRGLRYLAEYDGARRANPAELYNVWAHTYALQALARAFREDGIEAYREAALRHLGHLERYETFIGGWNYYDFEIGARKSSMEPTSFGTAAGLAALYEARQAGIEIPYPLLRRALRQLAKMRLPGGSFLYSGDHRYHPVHLANRDKGSLGRTQAGNYALWIWDEGKISPAEVRAGLDAFFLHHKFLDIARKRQYPHEAWYYNSGYYYYFGHYYAAKLIERLDDPGDYRERLAACVLPWQEPDGSWWDYRMYDYAKSYGTAFALMTLRRCNKTATLNRYTP